MNAVEIANMIRECFANTGECVSACCVCEICDYYDTCYMIATAFTMVLEGNYYG